MRLSVLGSAASYPGPGHACAGYLVQTSATSVLLDCGNGVLANLGRVIDPVSLGAVVISHGHIDHFADVFALQAALRYAPSGPVPPLPLYLPPGLFDRMEALLGERGGHELREAFRVHEVEPGVRIDVGDLSIVPHAVDHAQSACAFVVTRGDARLCYTGDTQLGDAVRAAARGAGTLLADATLPEEYAGRAPHMTPAEAGELARDAGAHTLLLTHLWPTVDRDRALVDARERFGGRVIVADEQTVLDID
ncbi:MAG: MBL fold metallo-hydrolase [Coriobacteriia bacterium]|nr:MBL fold metallo-hydrolase [Coriobacteriia bacterium]MBN2840363.1 MBL fold metallo-hydrolase [Coriobacteriia bacterium]